MAESYPSYASARPLRPPPLIEQIGVVSSATFEKKRLLNLSEYRAFRLVEREVRAAGRRLRVFAQTSLGEVLRTDDREAFHSINAKRVDMLVVDGGGWPIVAIEYQGSGHYLAGEKTRMRDAVKREALASAGIVFLELLPEHGDAEVRALLRQALRVALAEPRGKVTPFRAPHPQAERAPAAG